MFEGGGRGGGGGSGESEGEGRVLKGFLGACLGVGGLVLVAIRVCLVLGISRGEMGDGECCTS